MGTANIPNRPIGSDVRSISDMLANFDAITAQVNGNLEAVNMHNNLKPATLLGAWRTVGFAYAPFTSSDIAATYMLSPAGGKTQSGLNNSSGLWFGFDPADYTIPGLTAKCRLRTVLARNGTAPGINITGELRRITSSSGSAGNLVATLSAPHISVAFATPLANLISNTTSLGEENLPAAAPLAFCVTLSGAPAANSVTLMTLALQIRHV